MKRSIWIASGMVTMALLLVGAVFVTEQLLSDKDRNNGSEQKMVLNSGVLEMIAEPLDIQNAKELPNIPPDASGLFVRREDKSLFVGTGNMSGVVVGGDQGSASRWDIRYDGPVVEVVVTRDTLIYHDVTSQQFTDSPPSGSIQQVLDPGTLDEIGKDSIVGAWGERRGDRVVAEVLVFSAAKW
jgi:hypothetical protein